MLEFDTGKMSDDEILNKIDQINKQLVYSSSMASSRSVANQLYLYLDLLYQEQDERMFNAMNKDDSPGIVYDSEESFKSEEKLTNSKSQKKNSKKVNFLTGGPKIERKYNKQHPTLRPKDE